MVASTQSIEQMASIILKHIDKKQARAMVRELYHRVKGNQSVMQTLLHLAQRLEEEE